MLSAMRKIFQVRFMNRMALNSENKRISVQSKLSLGKQLKLDTQ